MHVCSPKKSLWTKHLQWEKKENRGKNKVNTTVEYIIIMQFNNIWVMEICLFVNPSFHKSSVSSIKLQMTQQK